MHDNMNDIAAYIVITALIFMTTLLLLAVISSISIGIKPWISIHIHTDKQNMITQPCPDFAHHYSILCGRPIVITQRIAAVYRHWSCTQIFILAHRVFCCIWINWGVLCQKSVFRAGISNHMQIEWYISIVAPSLDTCCWHITHQLKAQPQRHGAYLSGKFWGIHYCICKKS